jgi:hypothetical protein
MVRSCTFDRMITVSKKGFDKTSSRRSKSSNLLKSHFEDISCASAASTMVTGRKPSDEIIFRPCEISPTLASVLLCTHFLRPSMQPHRSLHLSRCLHCERRSLGVQRTLSCCIHYTRMPWSAPRHFCDCRKQPGGSSLRVPQSTTTLNRQQNLTVVDGQWASRLLVGEINADKSIRRLVCSAGWDKVIGLGEEATSFVKYCTVQ